MLSIRRIVALGTIVPGLVAVTAHAQVLPDGGFVSIKWSIDGQPEEQFFFAGEPTPEGDIAYVGQIATQQGMVIGIEYVVDPMTDLSARIAGQVRCDNTSSLTHNMTVSINFPFCPSAPEGTAFGGMVTVYVETDEGGGSLVCPPGASSIWQATIGQVPIYSAFYCPFQMATTGSGTMRTTHVFGAPIPSLPGPAVALSAGSRNNFRVTPGDAVKVTSSLIIESLGSPPRCLADLTGDGEVDGDDLAWMLASWGPIYPCTASDLNGDGEVDGDDVAILLAAWGPC